MPENINLHHIGEHRLEISTATNLMRCQAEFVSGVGAARRRARELRQSGFSVAIFRVTEHGGLIPV